MSRPTPGLCRESERGVRRRCYLGAAAMVALLGLAVPLSGAAAKTSSAYLNVWVHYDYMIGSDGSFAPSKNAIRMVV
ncbi:MAG TPA: hypothetical protein VKC59_02990, partial [Candidatus Limnocylindrales bacterium]|nr:hypothetical protein [Candidatus Limnocylindrales bacterium]